jgi:hypothetical protein
MINGLRSVDILIQNAKSKYIYNCIIEKKRKSIDNILDNIVNTHFDKIKKFTNDEYHVKLKSLLSQVKFTMPGRPSPLNDAATILEYNQEITKLSTPDALLNLVFFPQRYNHLTPLLEVSAAAYSSAYHTIYISPLIMLDGQQLEMTVLHEIGHIVFNFNENNDNRVLKNYAGIINCLGLLHGQTGIFLSHKYRNEDFADIFSSNVYDDHYKNHPFCYMLSIAHSPDEHETDNHSDSLYRILLSLIIQQKNLGHACKRYIKQDDNRYINCLHDG